MPNINLRDVAPFGVTPILHKRKVSGQATGQAIFQKIYGAFHPVRTCEFLMFRNETLVLILITALPKASP